MLCISMYFYGHELPATDYLRLRKIKKQQLLVLKMNHLNEKC